jgi:hypothetical protein
MPHQLESATQFQRLQKDVVEGYEHELELHREELVRLAQLKSASEKHLDEALASVGLDLDRLKAFDRHEEDLLEATLQDMRPELLDRPSQHQQTARLRQLYYELPHPGGVAVPPYAGTLVAAEAASLEGNAGEWGNPWVLPYDPGLLRIKTSLARGSGSGCWAVGIPPPATAWVWFTFVPDRTGPWYMRASVSLHGFYALVSNDTFWTCKSAEVHVSAGIDAEQYEVWRGRHWVPVLDIEYDNVNRFALFDRLPVIEMTTPVRAGDPVWVLANVTISAFAKGSGAYAEVNLADGNNYVEPVVLIAYPDF